MVKGTARTAVSIVPKQGQDLLATAVRALPTGLNLLTSVVGTAVGTAASVVPEQGRDLIHMAVSTVTPKQGRELVRRSLLALSWQGGDRPPKPGTMTEVIPPEHIMDLQQSGNELKVKAGLCTPS